METPLVVREISPVTGGTAGGLVVTISGTNFVPSQGPSPATVLFGGAVASNVAVLSATELQATTPALNAALVDVVVTTVGGTLRLPGAFKYQ